MFTVEYSWYSKTWVVVKHYNNGRSSIEAHRDSKEEAEKEATRLSRLSAQRKAWAFSHSY